MDPQSISPLLAALIDSKRELRRDGNRRDMLTSQSDRCRRRGVRPAAYQRVSLSREQSLFWSMHTSTLLDASGGFRRRTKPDAPRGSDVLTGVDIAQPYIQYERINP